MTCETSAPADPRPMQTSRRSGWSDARRARHRAAMMLWKPWLKSTGPRTAQGKAVSRMNARKHGNRSAACRHFDALLTAHRKWLALLKWNRREKIYSANELLESLPALLPRRPSGLSGMRPPPRDFPLRLDKVRSFGFNGPS